MIAVAKGNSEIIDLMLRNEKIDINQKDEFGVNAFWIACFYGKVEAIKTLNYMNIDMHVKNQNGSNSLHIAVKRGLFDVV